jgi:hypothetical protein
VVERAQEGTGRRGGRGEKGGTWSSKGYDHISSVALNGRRSTEVSAVETMASVFNRTEMISNSRWSSRRLGVGGRVWEAGIVQILTGC